MLKSQRVACYLNGFAGHGEDPDSKELKLVFHISPIPHDLASEISPHLADRLFRMEDNEWMPVLEMPKASFSKIGIPLQNITFSELPDADQKETGILVHGAAVSNLRAQRAYPEGLDYRLEFDVVVPMDGITMRLVEKYYKATAFLTMEEIQAKLDLDGDKKIEVRISLQEAADGTEEPAGKRKKRSGKDAAAGE